MDTLNTPYRQPSLTELAEGDLIRRFYQTREKAFSQEKLTPQDLADLCRIEAEVAHSYASKRHTLLQNHPPSGRYEKKASDFRQAYAQKWETAAVFLDGIKNKTLTHLTSEEKARLFAIVGTWYLAEVFPRSHTQETNYGRGIRELAGKMANLLSKEEWTNISTLAAPFDKLRLAENPMVAEIKSRPGDSVQLVDSETLMQIIDDPVLKLYARMINRAQFSVPIHGNPGKDNGNDGWLKHAIVNIPARKTTTGEQSPTNLILNLPIRNEASYFLPKEADRLIADTPLPIDSLLTTFSSIAKTAI